MITDSKELPPDVVAHWQQELDYAYDFLDVRPAPMTMITFYSVEKLGLVGVTVISADSRGASVLLARACDELVGSVVHVRSVGDALSRIRGWTGNAQVGFTVYVRDHVNGRYERLNVGSIHP
jgi:hypothetical protein